MFWPGENNLHHHKARVYETICFFDRSRSLISRSYYSGLSLACLVMRDDVLLFIHSWDKMSYSVHEHDFESPRVLDVNRGNSHTSHDVGFILITFGEFILSVSSEGQN